jgi:hypothetical protein
MRNILLAIGLLLIPTIGHAQCTQLCDLPLAELSRQHQKGMDDLSRIDREGRAAVDKVFSDYLDKPRGQSYDYAPYVPYKDTRTRAEKDAFILAHENYMRKRFYHLPPLTEVPRPHVPTKEECIADPFFHSECYQYR